MDAEIDTENYNMEVVEADLIFKKPPDITDFELVKTFWVVPKEAINSTNDQFNEPTEPAENAPQSEPDQESKQLQPLSLKTIETTEDEGSSCSHSETDQLPDEILNEPLDDEVFEEEEETSETVSTDLLFRQPKNTEMELVYTISKGATINLDELEEEDDDVDVDLWFREPTDTRFELVYTIPLMEDVSVDSLEGTTLEDVPPPEELDNVIEEAAEFTFNPIENDEEKTETETLTTEVTTVLEKVPDEHVGEGSRDFIEKIKLTSNDTFDEFDGEEEAFQNAFVKSVETPETPTPKGDFDEDERRDDSVSDVLKDAAEKLQIIQDSENLDYSNDLDTVESEDAVIETASAPDLLDVGSPVEALLSSGSPKSEDAESYVSASREHGSEQESIVEGNQSSKANENPTFTEENGEPLEIVDRFDVVPVEETPAVKSKTKEIKQATKTFPSESDSTISDFAQLESISASEDIPDVYKTLDSLSNEDVFPKEATPSPPRVLDSETPKARSEDPQDNQAELKLEDSGIAATPDIADLVEEDIKQALNSEDVVSDDKLTGYKTEATEANTLSSPESALHATDEFVNLEDSGDVVTPEVVAMEATVVDDALNGEDVIPTESMVESSLQRVSNPVVDQAEETQILIKLEDSGLTASLESPKLISEDITDALNSENVVQSVDNQERTEVTQTVGIEETAVQEVTQNMNDSQTVVRLEDAGITATPDTVELGSEEIVDALNGEDVVKSSDQLLGPDVNQENDQLSEQLEDDANRFALGAEPAITVEEPAEVQEFLKLEESGETVIPAIPKLKAEEITDSLNNEDDIKTFDKSLEVEIQEISTESLTTSGQVDDLVNEPEHAESELKLEDCGIVDTSDIVPISDESSEDALNCEDVIKRSDEVSDLLEAIANEENFADSEHVAAHQEADHVGFKPVEIEEVEAEFKLEDSGISDTPDIIEFNENVAADALSGEDVVTENIAEPVSKLIFPDNFLDEDELLPSEREESVTDSQIEENSSQEKESTPVRDTSVTDDSGVKKLTIMVEDVLPVNDSSLSEDVENQLTESEAQPEVQKEHTPVPVSETPVADDSEEAATELSFVNKLVSMVEEALPVDAVIPSEDVLNEENVHGRRSEESLKPDAIIASNVVVGEQNEEIPATNTEPLSNDDVKTTDEGESMVQKFVSMVQNALPHSSEQAVPPEESTQEVSRPDEPSPLLQGLPSEEPIEEEKTMMQKLVSMVESVLPVSSENEPTEEPSEDPATNPPSAEPEATPDEPTSVIESLMETVVSMVENVLPVDAIILSDYVDQVERHFDEVRSLDVANKDENLVLDVTQEVIETVSQPIAEESIQAEKRISPGNSVSDDFTKEIHNEPTVDSQAVETTFSAELKTPESVETNTEKAEELALVDKLLSIVENVLPTNAVIPSEDVLNEEHAVIITDEGVSQNEDPEIVSSTESVSENEEQSEKPNQELSDAESVVEKVVSMVENTPPTSSVIPSDDVPNEDHIDVVSTDDVTDETAVLDTESSRNEFSEQITVLEKLTNAIEGFLPSGILPTGHVDEKNLEDQSVESESQLQTENQNGLTVAEVIATADIILPVEETAPALIETPFDAEGFVPDSDKTPSANNEIKTEEGTDEKVIETADIILPVNTENIDESFVLETPFDAEVFPPEPVVEEKEQVAEVLMSTDDQEKSTTVGELVAMAIEILPIDGPVAENIEEPEKSSAVLEASIPVADEPILDSDPSEITNDISVQTSHKEDVPAESVIESSIGPGVFKRVKRGGSYEEAVHQDNSVSADDFVDSEITETSIPVPIIRKYEAAEAVPETPINMGSPHLDEIQVATVEVAVEQEPTQHKAKGIEEPIKKTIVLSSESAPHRITDLHFSIPKNHEDYGNDYVPFGTEPSKFEFNNPNDVRDEEDDVVAELNFHPVRQWKDEDVISLQSLKSLVAEVGCTTDVEEVPRSPNSCAEASESTLKILKVVPSEPSLMELDISNDPSVIHVPIPLMEPATKYLEDMVEWIIADAVKEVSEMEVVTESELSEMVPQESETECSLPEPLDDLKLPFEDDEKTPEPEQVLEESPIEVTKIVDTEAVATIPQRPPRAPKTESSRSSDPPKSRVRFGPLNIKLGRSYSEEQQKELVEMLERPLTVITSTEPKTLEANESEAVEALSPLSPNTLAEYEDVPMMDIQSVPHSPQEKQEESEMMKALEKSVEAVEAAEKVDVLKEKSASTTVHLTETKILGPGKSLEYVGNEEEDGSECLDSIGDLSERTIQRFNTSIDDPSIRRDSFSSISSFGDRQKFRTAIENIRQDLLPFQSSVSQYLDPSVTPSQQLLATNLSMDSPSDLSPNAPPVGFENTAQYLEKIQQQQQQQEDRPSAEGSIDSSGFEKVDHESLEDYGAPVQDPMQKSVFGSLGADADADDLKPGSQDDGFVFIERNEATEGTKKKMSSHHDDVIEKDYYGGDAATAKLLESPIAEEARKLVQDAVESASEYSKHAVDDADEIGRELLDNVEHKIEQAKEPVADTLHKAYDGLGDFVHETVPEAVHDFVEEAKQKLPESPVPEKIETPEPTDDIHDSVDKVHDEINNFLRSGRDPTPPLVEADEDAPIDDKPQFGNQTPEEDETTFDRKGPLTIPEEVEKAAAAQKYDEDLDEFDPLVTSNTGAAFGAAVGTAASEALTEEEIFGHQKFETVPRPPTPPKDISDEDVKPSTVNLGPAHHHSHPSSPHHSILKHHGEAWIDFKTVPPCVLDVIYWRDVKKSGIVFGLAVLALFILAKYPILTVITYSLLLALGAAAGFRIFKKVEAQIKKTNTENPFSEILAQDLALPQEKVHAQADVFVEHATCIANTLKKLVFVESPLESIKFGLLLWSLTYVASWFSGFTLSMLALLGVFSIPKVYEANQDAIDPHLATISGHLKNVQNLIDEKLPFLRSAPVAAEEKKDQ